MYESHKKVFWCVVILNLSLLFPRYAFAHTTGAFGELIFLCPILIPLANILKFIVLKIIRPYEGSIPLGIVILIEIFLFFLCLSIIVMVKGTLLYKGLIDRNVPTANILG